MKNKKIILCILAALVVLGGYCWFTQTHISSDNRSVYLNSKYGYTLRLPIGATQHEDSEGGMFVQDSIGTLDVNVAPASAESIMTPNNTVNLNGQVAKLYTFTDEKGYNRKSYHILHNGLIYEITFAPLDDVNLQASAESFRFTN